MSNQPREATEAIRHLYVHIPFCPRKCDYCAFVTHVGSGTLVAPYLAALKQEARLQAGDYPHEPLDTVYFGGGTPSMLSPAQIADLLDHFSIVFGLTAGCEITLEAHPATLSARSLGGYRQAGVTRLSIGAESFSGRALRALGRDHSATQVTQAVEWTRKVRFDSLSLDLMYGFPTHTPASWRRSLRTLTSLEVDHISLYPLQVERGTRFGLHSAQGRLELPTDDVVANMYQEACEILSAVGFEHYEVSSWSVPGAACLHNLAYWHNAYYFGIGVGAHRHMPGWRIENIRQTGRYISRIRNRLSVDSSRERIDDDTRLVETAMLGLRLLSEGVPLSDIPGNDRRFMETPRFRAATLQERGLVSLSQDRVRLLESAVPVANEVWERLAFFSPAA